MSKAKPSMRPFFILFSGQGISMLGTQAVQFGLIWWLTVRTGSASVVAGATLLALLPRALFGPVAGALVDRWDRRRIMLAADSATALMALGLAGLFAAGAAQPWQVLLLLFLRGIGEMFHEASMLASTSLMVPKEQLTRIQGLTQSLAGLLLIVAPPLGALLYAALPMAGVAAVDAVTALFAIVPLLLIAIPRPPRSEKAAEEKPSLYSETVAGFRYLWGRPGHLWLLLIAATINLFLTPAFALLPLMVHGEGSGPGRFAATAMAFGVGMLGGGVLLGAWGGFRRRIATTWLGLILLGLSVLGIGLVPVTSLAFVALLALVGAAATLTNGPIQAILQATVAADYQGRVFATYGSLATLVAPIGLLFAGPFAELFGARSWFLMGGSITLVMALLAALSRPIREIEDSGAVPDRVVDAGASSPAMQPQFECAASEE